MTGIDAPIGLRVGENGPTIWTRFRNAVNGLLTMTGLIRTLRDQPADRQGPVRVSARSRGAATGDAGGAPTT